MRARGKRKTPGSRSFVFCTDHSREGQTACCADKAIATLTRGPTQMPPAFLCSQTPGGKIRAMTGIGRYRVFAGKSTLAKAAG